MSWTAQKIRAEKALRPWRFCSVPACLWRTLDQHGNRSICRKHPNAPVIPTPDEAK